MKDKLLGYLFKGYAKRLKSDYDNQLELKLSVFKATFDVKDLIRERLKGIRPNHPEENSILQNHLAGLDDVSRLAFLSKAYGIIENNEAFKVVLNSLMVEQEHFSMMNSSDMVDVNFGRATINGLMLLEDQLTALKNLYLNETEFNVKMTDAEKFSEL